MKGTTHPRPGRKAERPPEHEPPRPDRSFSRGGNNLTSASLASTEWGLAEKEEEGSEERVLLPEVEREDEVSTGEEAVKEERWTERWY